MMDVYEKIQIKSNVDNTTPQMPATVAEMVTYEDNKNSEEVRADLEKSVAEINTKMLTKDDLKITKGRTHYGSDATEYLEYAGELHEFATGDFVDYFNGFESTAVSSTTMDTNTIWVGTKEEYDALDAEEKSKKDLFFTTDEPYASMSDNSSGGVDVTIGNTSSTLAKQSSLAEKQNTLSVETFEVTGVASNVSITDQHNAKYGKVVTVNLLLAITADIASWTVNLFNPIYRPVGHIYTVCRNIDGSDVKGFLMRSDSGLRLMEALPLNKRYNIYMTYICQ